MPQQLQMYFFLSFFLFLSLDFLFIRYLVERKLSAYTTRLLKKLSRYTVFLEEQYLINDLYFFQDFHSGAI